MEPTVLDRLLEISALFQRDMQNAFAGTALTETRVHALWVLQHSGPVTQQVLAQALGTTPRSVSALIDALVDAGYVVRGPHPTDRRAHLVMLTEAASVLMAGMQSDHEQLTSTLLSAVDPADRPGFDRGVGAVLDRLRGLVASGTADYSAVEHRAEGTHT